MTDGPKGKQTTMTVRRFLAACDYAISEGGKAWPKAKPCPWNDRPAPVTHGSARAAAREASAHAVASGHVGSRAVRVRRTIEVVREEIIPERAPDEKKS